MPQLTREQFEHVRRAAVESAPDGLSREQFAARLDEMLARAEDANYDRTPETAEANAPAPRTNRLAGDPSTFGFIKKLGQQAYETVADLPKTIRGLSKIDPSELPGQIVRGVSQRVSDYANSPLETIYEDPLGFLGDVASVTGAGAAMAAPAKAGAREVAKQGARAAAAAGDVTDIGLAALKGAAAETPVLGPMGRGAFRGVRDRLARRAEISGGRLVPRNEQALRAFADDVAKSLEKNPALDVADEGVSVGGSASGRSSARGVTLEPSRINTASGEMVATRPDKWGTASIHAVDDIENALRPPNSRLRSGVTTPEANLAEAMAKSRTGANAAVDLTGELNDLGSIPLSPTEVARARAAERFGRNFRSELFDRYTRKLVTNPQEQELLRELTRARAQGF